MKNNMKGNRKNVFLKVMGAIFLVGILAAGICCTGFASRGEDGKWFKNGNIPTWHWKDTVSEELPVGGDEKRPEESGGQSGTETPETPAGGEEATA